MGANIKNRLTTTSERKKSQEASSELKSLEYLIYQKQPGYTEQQRKGSRINRSEINLVRLLLNYYNIVVSKMK